jgi:hypothetical protein
MAATVTRIEPSTSTPLSRPIASVSSMSTRPSSSVAIPIGTLMKKIQCQLIACVSAPPASRPIEPPLEMMKV